MPHKPVIPQTKAVILEVPGHAVAIRTENGDQVVLTPNLALELAERIRQSIPPAVPVLAPVAPGRNQLVQ